LAKTSSGSKHILWGVILFFVPFIFPEPTLLYDEDSGQAYYATHEWIRWVGIGLIVYGFVKSSRESND
jgi:hypothetical protein